MKPTKTLILYLLEILSLSSTLSLIEADLIDDTCRATSSYELCVSILHADPSSAQATKPSQLGVIIVRHVESKAKETLDRITQLLGRTQDPKEKGALEGCKGLYSTILQDVKPSYDAFNFGDPKFAVDYMNDAAGEATRCESGFGDGNSPIASENDDVNKSALVAVAIATTLL